MSLLRRVAPRTFMARRNLLRARSRSALAVLTIVIGVVAIASLGASGATFAAVQSDALGDIGNQVMVFPGDDVDGGFDDRTLRDVERVSGDATVAPLQQETGTTDPGGRTTVMRTDEAATLFEVEDGSVPANWRTGAVVGATFADEQDLSVGETVEVNGQIHAVVAILEEQGATAVVQVDDAVVLPMATAEVQLIHQVVVQTESSTEASQVADDLRGLNDRQELVSVQDMSELTDQFDELFWYLNVFLVGIAGISLVVAGISIANVMLMSAIERREEIGVLRAVGYQRRDVLGMMLAEATLLGVVGAAIGLAISTLVAAGMNTLLLDDPLAFQPEAIQYLVLAVVFGIGVSLVAGFYPAWKASKQRPVEALRG